MQRNKVTITAKGNFKLSTLNMNERISFFNCFDELKNKYPESEVNKHIKAVYCSESNELMFIPSNSPLNGYKLAVVEVEG